MSVNNSERAQLVGAAGRNKTANYDTERGARGQEAALERRPLPELGADDGVEGAQVNEVTKSLVFGAMDGVLSGFAVVAGAEGGGLGIGVALVLGLASILANGLSLGVGEFLSSKAHNDYVDSQRRREEWALLNHREANLRVLTESYMRRGLSQADAEAVVQHFSKYDNVLVDSLVSEEIGSPSYEHLDDLESFRDGIFMFLGFSVAGILPLLTYALAPLAAPEASSGQLFAASAGVTAVLLFVVGALKSTFSTRSWFCAGVEALVLGIACAGIAYELANGLAAWAEAEGLL